MADSKDQREKSEDTQSCWEKLRIRWPLKISDFNLFKLFFFFFYGSNGAIFPYLPVYFKQLGLLASHVGMLTGFRPLIQCLAAPFWGIVADKYRIRKELLLIGLVAWLLKTMFILIVQPHEQTCDKVTRTHNFTVKEHSRIYSGSLNGFDATDTLLDNTGYFPKLTGLNDISGMKTNENGSTIHKHKRSFDNPYRIVTKVIDEDGSRTTYIRHNDRDEVAWMFKCLLVLIILGEFLESPTITLADASLLNQLQESKHSYGKFRMWGSVGFTLTSFVVGYLLYTTTALVCGQTFENYSVAFYFFAGFVSLALLCVVFIGFSYEPREHKSSSEGLVSLFLNIRCCALLAVIFHMGFCHGFVINFINWYLDDLEATVFLMGVSMALRHAADFSTFFLAGKIVTTIGHINIIKISLLIYSLSLACYSILINPWWVIPLEILLGATYAASWTACVSFFGSSAPRGSIATVQGILQGVYWGLGLGIGAIAGGFLVHALGVRVTLRIFAVATMLVLLSFLLVEWVCSHCSTAAYESLSSDKKESDASGDDEPDRGQEIAEELNEEVKQSAGTD